MVWAVPFTKRKQELEKGCLAMISDDLKKIIGELNSRRRIRCLFDPSCISRKVDLNICRCCSVLLFFSESSLIEV